MRLAMMVLSGGVSAALLTGCGGDAPDDAAGGPGASPAATPPAGAAGAPPPAAANLPPGVTAQMVQEGQQIFNGQGICFTCHGQNGTGGQLGPALNDQNWIHLSEGTLEEIETVIRTGVMQPREYSSPMPAMGGARLSDDQLRSVAAYVYGISRGA